MRGCGPRLHGYCDLLFSGKIMSSRDRMPLMMHADTVVPVGDLSKIAPVEHRKAFTPQGLNYSQRGVKSYRIET